MGRAGRSSSSVHSSSPSLSLSDERAGPEESIDGASCLSARQGRSWEREQCHKSSCEKQVLGDTELLNGRSRAKRSSKMTACNVDAHPLLAHIPYSVLTDWVQAPFGERMVLAA